MKEIATLKAYLSIMTVTGEAAIPLALCIQATKRLEEKANAYLKEHPEAAETAKEKEEENG